ncbi:hypothetical protein BOX15_Mlig000799g2 [Macrostomum lignano]|uniref:EGF-like domain-containing protein n=4 Tax=Macrostomum lignano TaxID=282301 RepID=A0A267GA58_9PLAT|nr:hypothetical protein BOX15_Mlig000799g2 [Macrostomum lignano]
MTSTPDSLFTSASGRRYQFKSANKKVDWYNKLISWKYWTVCGRFSNLLTRTTIGMEEIMLNQACRSQHALFLAIRSTKPLKIFDIQAYRRVSQRPVGGIPPAYLSFACPTSQYGGFTPEFVSANLRPYKLDMSQMGRFYDLLNISVTKLLDVNRACYLPDLRQNPYREITNRACNYTRETIRVTQLSYRKSITKVVQNFVKSSMEPDIPDYILNVLANLAEDFLKSWGGEVTVRRDPIQFKLNWTSYMMTQVPTDSKLRSDLFYNGHVCFISCHWAHRLSSLANKFNASDEIVPLMFSWFLEAFCPDPCANARCKRVKNSENGQCTISQSGLWADSYECICKAGHYWSRSTHDCVPQLLCNRPRDSSEYPCSPRYTLYCESRVTKVGKNGTEAEAETETICVCKEGYGGSRCERLADPCTDRHPLHRVSGNFACATYDGKCV